MVLHAAISDAHYSYKSAIGSAVEDKKEWHVRSDYIPGVGRLCYASSVVFVLSEQSRKILQLQINCSFAGKGEGEKGNIFITASAISADHCEGTLFHLAFR